MGEFESLTAIVFNVKDDDMFEEAALRVYRYQFEHCSIYRDFARLLHRTPDRVATLGQIPFIPVEFFRDFRIISGELPPHHQVFESSGTMDMSTSKHYVSNLDLYHESLIRSFKLFWGEMSEYSLLALLPGYLERPNSSLVHMMRHLMRFTPHDSGFFLHDHEALYNKLTNLKEQGQRTMLLGVSHALIDFAELHPIDFKDLIIIETGGMKGRREEIVREELHHRLKETFGVERVASEYGMTELLSQAWSVEKGSFKTPPWMRVIIRDPNDPFGRMPHKRTGGINVIDLANINSCSFIATQDLGRSNADGTFEVLGRFDNSDLRGCNLLAG